MDAHPLIIIIRKNCRYVYKNNAISPVCHERLIPYWPYECDKRWISFKKLTKNILIYSRLIYFPWMFARNICIWTSIELILFHSDVAFSHDSGGSEFTVLNWIALSILVEIASSCLDGWLFSVRCRLILYSSMVNGCEPIFITQRTDSGISTLGLIL